MDNCWVQSFLGGTYCTNLAAEPGLAIQSRFIEPDSVTVKQLPASADLSISKICKDVQGNPCDSCSDGSDISFTISVMNNGPSPTTNVLVRDILPASVAFKSFTASKGWYDSMSGIWSVGSLEKDQSATLVINVNVCAPGVISNRAQIISSGVDDPNGLNDAAECSVEAAEKPPCTEGLVNLSAGYNLISLPIIPASSDCAGMMAGLDYNLVAYYDAKSGEWFYHDADGPSDLNKMVDGCGYWVDMNSSGTLAFSGYEICAPPPSVPPSYELSQGWNLMGYKCTKSKAPSVYMSGCSYNCVIIYGYANGRYFQVTEGFGGHQMLQPGQGYWVAMSNPGTIYP